MSNADPKLVSIRDRRFNLEERRREVVEDIKELKKEAKGVGLSKAEVAGIELDVKRKFESAEKKAARTEAEEVADSLALSGGAPLFESAKGARETTRRAMANA